MIKNKLLSIKILLLFFAFVITANAQNEDENLMPPHYVFSQFTKGVVKLKDGRIETPMLNYNKLTEEVIFINNGQNLSLTRLETIDTVTIQSRKFIPVGKVFYELLLNAPVSLFIQHKSRMQMVGSEVGYGGTSQVSSTTRITSMSSSGLVYNLKLPDECTVNDDSHIWVRKDNQFYPADNERDVKKIFPEKEAVVKLFFKSNKLKLKNIDDSKKLGTFLNTWK